jgi:SAM-dependent methyltransferase
MRVLDDGCGTGESTALVAALDAPGGAVVGADRDAAALAVARGRVAAGGAVPVAFVEADLHDAALPGPFDAAVGRFVLAFQADVAAAVRAVARHVRPGGPLAFVEIDRTPPFPTLGELPLWQRIGALVGEGLTRAGVRRHAGLELCPALLDAGLVDVRATVVDAFLQCPGDRFGSEHLVALLRALLPRLEADGVVTAAALDLDTLVDRLVAEVDAARVVGRGPLVFGAWGRVPPRTPAVDRSDSW